MTTLKDIAKKANLSITQVSRALNNHDDVSEKTKERVNQIAKDLGYVPNQMARNLSSKSSNSIGLIISGFHESDPYDTSINNIIKGVYWYCSEHGLEAILHVTNTHAKNNKSFTHFCREHNLKGALLIGVSSDEPYLQDLIKSQYPCVLIDIPVDTKNVGSISINEVAASKEAVEYLIRNNHKRIALMKGREHAAVSTEREEGYKKALENNDIELDENLILNGNFNSIDSYSSAYSFLSQNKDVTAIFCQSDLMALGVMNACRDLNIKIPDELSIVGFDDNPLSNFVNPPLTTVRHDMYKKSYYGTQLLMDIINKKVGNHNIILDHELVIRKSVKMI